jgi:NADPH:quinone reductase-like Zn-dependent oxidoreductase
MAVNAEQNRTPSYYFWSSTDKRCWVRTAATAGLCRVSFGRDRARDSMREITHLIDGGQVRVPPVDVLPLEDAARAHQMIDTGHVRGKLVLKVAELSG